MCFKITFLVISFNFHKFSFKMDQVGNETNHGQLWIEYGLQQEGLQYFQFNLVCLKLYIREVVKMGILEDHFWHCIFYLRLLNHFLPTAFEPFLWKHAQKCSFTKSHLHWNFWVSWSQIKRAAGIATVIWFTWGGWKLVGNFSWSKVQEPVITRRLAIGIISSLCWKICTGCLFVSRHNSKCWFLLLRP